MRRLRPCSEWSFVWAFDKVQAEGLTEGWIGGMHEMLRRQVRKKFGLNRQAARLELVAGLQTAYQLEHASEFLLDCQDTDEFARLPGRLH